MEHVIMFSGGVDSTVLLDDLIRNPEITQLHIVAIEPNFIGSKQAIREKNARMNILAMIKAKTNKAIKVTDIKIDMFTSKKGKYTSPPYERMMFPLPMIWLTMVLPHIQDSDFKIYFGYNASDDMVHFLDEFNRILEAYKPFIGSTFENSTTIEMPYLNKTKSEMLQMLYRKDLESYVWYCEEPKEGDVPCGKCHSCEVHDEALEEITNKFGRIIL